MGSFFSKGDKKRNSQNDLKPSASSSSNNPPPAPPNQGFRTIPFGAITFSSDLVAGRGATAAVRRGNWKGTPVAVKTMFNVDVESFEKEVRALEQVGPHPCVLEVLGICKEANSLAIVTQFISKGNLGEWINSRGSMITWELALLMAMDISRGMLHIHEAGLIHRDLKPSNLLVSSLSLNDDDVRIKICDFGIARELRQKMTQAIGTPVFMAPEMYTSKYDGKVDVYAFGLILYEIFTGLSPYIEIPNFELPDQVIKGTRPTIPENIPPILRDLMAQCWAGDPQTRPDFNQILEVLKQAFTEKDSFQPL